MSQRFNLNAVLGTTQHY